MLAYLFKRILILVPTLFVISIIVFFISVEAPGDPAIFMLSKSSSSGDKNDGVNRFLIEKKRNELGMDKAVFYIGFSSLASYRNQNSIPFQREREMVKKLSIKTGQPELVEKYYEALLQSEDNIVYSLLAESNLTRIYQLLENLPKSKQSVKILVSFNNLMEKSTPYRAYIPLITWHGFDNQYHNWLINILKGDFGISYSDGKEVSSKIWNALKTTLSMTVAALLLSFAISILLAVLATYYSKSALPKLLDIIFFSLYSIPTFIIASIAIILLGSPQYLDLLPVYGIGEYYSTMNIWEKMSEAMSHLLLPILCLSYLPTAYLYQQLYGNLSAAMKMDYTKVAISKGLTKRKVISRHALRNSLLPVISFLGNIFPAVIGGSFVVEFIFSLPGMGILTMDAVFARDFPIVFSSMLLVSFAALVGALLSDLLLIFFDPRISMDKNH